MNKPEVIAALEKERDELVNKLHSLEMTILTLKQSISVPGDYGYKPDASNGSNGNGVSRLNLKYKDYPKGGRSNRDKVIAILRIENRFLHIRQIVKIAQELEPNVPAKDVQKSISQAVYSLKNLPNSPVVSVAVNKSNLNTFWGSKNWLDEKGAIKKEYRYDEDQVSQNKADTIEI